MIVRRTVRIEARFQVSQTLTPCNLCIQHGTELIPTRKSTHAKVPAEIANVFVERGPRQKGCQLAEDRVTVCHGLCLLVWVFVSGLTHVTYFSTGAQAFFFLFPSGNAKEPNPGNAKTCPPLQISKLPKKRFFPFLPSPCDVTHFAARQDQHLSTMFNRTALILGFCLFACRVPLHLHWLRL